jgi:hypothetical protein
MKSMAQPDLHPDADILNAFVEHVLPEAERVRAVAHMADCARCREVVFLARSAAQPETTPVMLSEPRPGWLSSAFAKWRVALIPAAALATVGGTVLWVQLHPLMMNRQMAKMAPLSPPQAAVPAPAQNAARKIEPPAKQHDELAASQSQSDSTPKPAQAETKPASDRKKTPAPDDGSMAMDNAVSIASPPTGKGSAPGALHLDGRSAAMAQSARRPQLLAAPPMATFSAPGPAPSPEQAQQITRATVAQAPVTFAAAPSTAAPPTPSTNVQMSSAALPVSPDFANVATGPAPHTEISAQQLHGLALMRLAGRPKLPSGLATVSSAVLLNRLVALDAAGALFLSEDGGMHWVRVHGAWSGKAVEVNAATMTLSQDFFRSTSAQKAQGPELTAVSTPPAAAKTSADNPPPPPAPPAGGSSVPVAASIKAKTKAAPPVLPPLFKLVTDRHEVWISSDGKLWRRQ